MSSTLVRSQYTDAAFPEGFRKIQITNGEVYLTGADNKYLCGGPSTSTPVLLACCEPLTRS